MREALDGLPSVKVHCTLLAEEAIHAALWDHAGKNLSMRGLKSRSQTSTRARKKRNISG